MKILIVTSSGGHLFKTYKLKPWWSKYNRVWVTKKDTFSTRLLKNEVVIEGNFPEQRNLINFFRNLFLALQVLSKEQPDVIFSTGAGIAPPFFFIAKLFRVRSVFIETFISIPQPTLSGKLLYKIVDLFLVQNKQLLKNYKKAKFWGSIL